MSDNLWNEEDDFLNDEPPVEAEDIGCQCTDDGIESQWEWDKRQSCYVCISCGDVQ